MKKLTAYERERLENIKRNGEMLAALKIHSKLNELKRTHTAEAKSETKSYKKIQSKKPKPETPVVLRRSLRARGVPPDAATAGGLTDDMDDKVKKIKKTPQLDSQTEHQSPKELGPIRMRDAYIGDDGLDGKLVQMILCCSKKCQSNDNGDINNLEKIEDLNKTGRRLLGSVDLDDLMLRRENVARVVPGRIMSMKFFPSLDMEMVVVGNKFGNIGFWNVNADTDESDGIYVYHPNPGPISGIVINPCSMSKVYSSCYDGFIRAMDVEKEVFDLVYSSEYAVYSISSNPHDSRSLYFSEGKGTVNVWDLRSGKSSLCCDLHEDRINTIDFNSETDHLMATSSTDGTACIWDLRKMNADKPASLNVVSHKRAVHSAYFSPTGKFLATTSIDNKIGILSGANYEDISMVYHNNQTGRWISTFRGVWGWDDSYIFIGNMERGVDVVSTDEKRTVATLKSDLMTAIPCRFDAHPLHVGMLAGATSGGQVYIWSV